ncbi:MAG: hypothetical protein ABEK17_03775 [Candidatus Aenigmatarchaeota archaeon]
MEARYLEKARVIKQNLGWDKNVNQIARDLKRSVNHSAFHKYMGL